MRAEIAEMQNGVIYMRFVIFFFPPSVIQYQNAIKIYDEKKNLEYFKLVLQIRSFAAVVLLVTPESHTRARVKIGFQSACDIVIS